MLFLEKLDKMITKKSQILYLLFFIGSIVLFFLYKTSYSISFEKFYVVDYAKKYDQECIDIFEKIRNPKNGTVFRPPLKEIPKELYDLFTQNGLMPVRNYWYFNGAYSDSDSNSNLSKNKPIVSKQEINKWRERVRKHETLSYGNTELQRIMFKYSYELKNKKIAIIGTQLVWIEAIALEMGTGKITTLDYTRKQYEQSDLLDWVHVNDFLDNAIQHSQTEQFDNAVSFSSIEHSGLGRYGDPLNPNGDIEAVRQVHCMLKPGGLFFLGLPSTREEKGFIEFNAHRYYGFKRLELLFQGWEKLEETQIQSNHVVYVLKKK
jgi:hypothetical protein